MVASLRQHDGQLQAREWLLGRDQRPLAASPLKPVLPPGFDPRLRPWYQLARREGRLVMAPVSRLALAGRPGLTLSQPLAEGKGVVGALMKTLAAVQGEGAPALLVQEAACTTLWHLSCSDGVEVRLLCWGRPGCGGCAGDVFG